MVTLAFNVGGSGFLAVLLPLSGRRAAPALFLYLVAWRLCVTSRSTSLTRRSASGLHAVIGREKAPVLRPPLPPLCAPERPPWHPD